MKLTAPNLNLLWSNLMLEELSRLGVRQVVISPGSRSAPLVIAAAGCETLQKTVHFDERGAAFYALGHARATDTPVVLICTSGTAAANYLPAIIEASQDRIPLIVMTADRPPELRDTGANQTIHQVGIFGAYIRWQFELPCPTIEIDPAMVLTTIDQAIYRASTNPAGPVLNCMFREPLAPISDEQDYRQYLSGLSSWLESGTPYTTYVRAKATVAGPFSEIIDSVSTAKRGLVIVGRLSNDAESAAVRNLIPHLGWPVIPDILSQLRLEDASEYFMPFADLTLSSESAMQHLAPDTILYLGDQVVSKRVLSLCKHEQVTTFIRVAGHPFRHDPLHRVTYRIEHPIAAFCDSLMTNISCAADDSYLKRWQSANQVVGDIVRKALLKSPLSEPGVAASLSRLLDPSHALFLANSLSIRNVDSFSSANGSAIKVASNRGASGIDGTIASAVGFANGTDRPLTLLIGDLALLHDLNSLALVAKAAHPITIILLNNDGGAIFGLLPVAGSFPDLDRYFIASHGYNFASMASQFGLDYCSPKSLSQFEGAYRKSAGHSHSLIEMTIDQSTDRAVRREIISAISNAIVA